MGADAEHAFGCVDAGADDEFAGGDLFDALKEAGKVVGGVVEVSGQPVYPPGAFGVGLDLGADKLDAFHNLGLRRGPGRELVLLVDFKKGAFHPAVGHGFSPGRILPGVDGSQKESLDQFHMPGPAVERPVVSGPVLLDWHDPACGIHILEDRPGHAEAVMDVVFAKAVVPLGHDKDIAFLQMKVMAAHSQFSRAALDQPQKKGVGAVSAVLPAPVRGTVGVVGAANLYRGAGYQHDGIIQKESGLRHSLARIHQVFSVKTPGALPDSDNFPEGNQMSAMTNKERVHNTLNLKPVDYAPSAESFWPDTHWAWQEKGWIEEKEDLVVHFDYSMRNGGWLNTTADLDFEPVVLEETEDTKLVLDGNGAKLRRHKKHASTPEHVDFTVQEREDWEEKIKPFLLEVDRRRIPFEGYRNAKQKCAEEDRFMNWAYVGPFEQMHPVCGHEYMLMGMAEDPEWVQDMVNTFVDFSIMHAETLFAEEGLPDGAWIYEDMGFKGKPFMSPGMYEEIVEPGHKKLFDYLHSKGLKVIVHSCGFVEPLVPGLVRAGMDCLQAMEVKAGMDMIRIAETYKEQIAFCGNFDVRTLISNDKAQIDAELEKKVVALKKMGGSYIIHSDHSIPPEVDHDTLVYFLKRAREITSGE